MYKETSQPVGCVFLDLDEEDNNYDADTEFKVRGKTIINYTLLHEIGHFQSYQLRKNVLHDQIYAAIYSDYSLSQTGSDIHVSKGNMESYIEEYYADYFVLTNSKNIEVTELLGYWLRNYGNFGIILKEAKRYGGTIMYGLSAICALIYSKKIGRLNLKR